MPFERGDTGHFIGLPYRTEFEPRLLAMATEGTLAFCEFHHEHLIRSDRAREFADTLANGGIPLHVHSTSLMFSDRVNETELWDLRKACEEFWVETFSGHLASGETHIALGEVFDRTPYIPSELARVVNEVRRAQDILGRVAVENIAYYGPPLPDQMNEIGFMQELQELSECELIFDVSNFLTSQQSRRLSSDSINQLGNMKIAYFHISGGRKVAGRYYDTHADPIPQEHLAALRTLVAARPSTQVLYERDGGFDRPEEIETDLLNITSLAG